MLGIVGPFLNIGTNGPYQRHRYRLGPLQSASGAKIAGRCPFYNVSPSRGVRRYKVRLYSNTQSKACLYFGALWYYHTASGLCPFPFRSLELIDEGETDHKIIALRVTDPDIDNINNMQVGFVCCRIS